MNHKPIIKKLLSLVTAFFMVMSLLPTSLISNVVQAATGETHYLAFASDRHSSTTAISSSMSAFKDKDVEYVCLAGDMVNNTESYNTSTVQSEVKTLFSNAIVDIVYGTHDANANDDAGIMNGKTSSGLIYTGASDAYYVYGIAYNDMSNSSSAATAAEAFTSWVKTVDTSKPIFIACHMPLHQRRGDNNGAATWLTAINSAAETHDIVYFWGHNHTGESSADTAVYLVNKGGTITPQGGSATTINFTYMNAGYLNQNTAATLVTLTDSAITLQKYTNGSVSDSTTITRTSSSGAATEKTISSISVNADSATKVFTKGGTFSSEGLVVTATYSDGTTGLVTDYTTSGYDMSTVGTQNVTVTAGEQTATYSITVSEPASDDGSVTITTEATGTTTVTSYKYASSVTSGEKYVLVSNGYALVNTDGTFSAVAVTVNDDGTITLGSDTTESSVLWTISENSSYTTYGAYTVVNSGSYLGRSSGKDAVEADVLTSVSKYAVWSYADDQLTQKGGQSSSSLSTYYAYYSESNSKFYTYTEAANLKLYQKTEDTVSTSTSVKYTVQASDISKKVGESETTTISASVLAGETAATGLNGTYSYEEVSDDSNIISSIEGDTITFTGNAGTATVKISYTWTSGDNTYTAYKTITVTTTAKVIDSETGEEVEEETQTASAKGTVSSSTAKTIYVLTSTITDGNNYLIVNTNTASTSAHALGNNNGSANDVSVTVNSAGTVGTTSISNPYIETTNSSIVWTASKSSSSYTFENNEYNIYSSSNSLSLSTSKSTSWTWSNQELYYKSSNKYYFLRYSSSDSKWTISNSSDTTYHVYVYEEQTVDATTSVTSDGTYAIDAADIEKTVVSGSTASITDKITFTADDSTTANEMTSLGGKYAYTVSSDGNSIIKEIASDGIITFTGAAGSAKVKVAYTFTVDSIEYTIWDTITVTAKEPSYSIDITDESDASITGTVSIKSVTSETTKQLNYAVSYTDETGTTAVSNPTGTVEWSSSDETIATVDTNGLVTFTGKAGSVNITVAYEVSEGKSVTDTIAISATTTSYVIPADGTTDFPEYPNQGAIRYDKTAEAVGSFNETGIAQLELSMTGVPYVTNNAIDVVMMLDMTGSMSDDDIDALQAAAKVFLESIVKNEDGSYNSNRIAIYYFNANGVSTVYTLGTVSSDSALSTIETAIDNMTQGQGGTPYDDALEQCESVLSGAKNDGTGNDRKQFCVFMSDGNPTSILWDGNSSSSSYSNGGDLSSVKDYTEHYSKEMKADGVTIYTVGLGITSDTYGYQSILTNIATDSDHAFFIEDSDAASGMSSTFAGIAAETKQAATEVTVVDKIADDYTLILSAPSGVTLPTDTTLAVQVVRYTLDENHERTTAEVIETVTASDTSKVTTNEDGSVSINADNFTYDASTHTLTWTADTLNTYELALSYYLYLNNSAGIAAADQVAAGTYPTNDYATITYTNFNGNECQQYFPVPQMTWNGAQVSYVFYLVNSDGKPVNKSGQVVDFANASFVTDIYTKAVTWNTDEPEPLEAKLLAEELLPSGYTLYDSSAEYDINVYEDETGTDLGNNFVIKGGESNGSTSSTTKVYNTKAGTKISAYGTYTSSNCSLDFANTTVAFAVVWSAKLNPDTIVIDYGLPVDIDVTTNDLFDNTVNGIGSGVSAYGSIAQDTGLSTTSKLGTNALTLNYGKASINGLYVRYTPTTMSMTDADTFYYESAVSYYEGSTKHEGYMYSKVTVIPATSIYYEDTFVTYNNGTSTEDEAYWYQAGSNDSTAVQDTDRPGASQIAATIDADNLYGYDSSYTNDTTYSNGGSHAVAVSGNTTKNPTATFTFTGTGFDLIALTSNTSGTVTCKVVGANTGYSKTWVVDTYYGYTYEKGDGYLKYTWKYGNDGKWHVTSKVEVDSNEPAEGEQTEKPATPEAGDSFVTFEKNGTWTTTNDEDNALYQIPVLSSPTLTYDTYTVTITPRYITTYDHTGNGQYEFYLDAVRVYGPSTSDTAIAAYVEDGEAYPDYLEVRNQLIVDATSDDELEGNGIVFIDGIDSTNSASNYTNYGPDNEVYLGKYQAVAFTLANDDYDLIAKTQIGLKAPNGSGSVIIRAYNDEGEEICEKTIELTSASELYYDISDIAKYTEGFTETIVIGNPNEDIVSVTNIKTTYTENPSTSTTATVDSTTKAKALTFLTANYLSSVPTAEEEVKIFEPETFTAVLSKTTVTVGSKITVKVTTSKDVADVTVNGEKVISSSVKRNGTIVWTYQLYAEEAGTMSIEAIAYDTDGTASEPVDLSVTVNEKSQSFFGRLFGWLGR